MRFARMSQSPPRNLLRSWIITCTVNQSDWGEIKKHGNLFFFSLSPFASNLEKGLNNFFFLLLVLLDSEHIFYLSPAFFLPLVVYFFSFSCVVNCECRVNFLPRSGPSSFDEHWDFTHSLPSFMVVLRGNNGCEDRSCSMESASGPFFNLRVLESILCTRTIEWLARHKIHRWARPHNRRLST